MSRYAPSQWTVGSQWIGDGGVYPGMGESIGLAGTSPELADGGLWNDGGAVGDPPFDTMQAASFDDSVGAGRGGYSYGGYGNYGGEIGTMPTGDSEFYGDEGADDNPLVGLAIAGGITLAFFWSMHRFRIGDQERFASIRGTAGDLAIIGVGAAFIIPLVKSTVTWVADFTDWQPLYDTSTYLNAA